MRKNTFLRTRLPRLIAIIGGSGSGKTRLANQLQQLLGKGALQLSLDDFYRDRSGVPQNRRERINFDHPKAIDWPTVENTLLNFSRNRPAQVPCYDFATHARLPKCKLVKPKSIILVDGLWLLRRPSIRRIFDYTIFLDCPARTRLRRRLARDLQQRSRSAASVRRQFLQTVAPMHRKFITPQRRFASVILRCEPPATEITKLAKAIASLTKPN
jgi:uridine kinase